jgi:hypothetical protein
MRFANINQFNNLLVDGAGVPAPNLLSARHLGRIA